jgi:hypothetical protein
LDIIRGIEINFLNKGDMMATMTPWGKSQCSKKYMRGVNEYGTAGHGGICVSKGVAKKYLSKYAIDVAIKYGNGYWFEEDCEWAIVAYEVPGVLEAMNENSNKIFTKEYILKYILKWHPNYPKS